MRGATVCSGIGAPEVAMPDVDWVFRSEIEPFPIAVMDHHHPHIPNWGDMTKFQEWPDADIDLLVGGTPCQSFSVAGLRKGLADPRGNLALTFLAIASKYAPRWILWENVPGVLSSEQGRDFGAFLGGLGQCGYGWAYRVLDAQYFGVPQRRRRVFVVGHLGDWRRAAAVLFERHSLSGSAAPRRETREGTAEGANDGIVGSLCADTHPGAYSGQDAYTGRLIAETTGPITAGISKGPRGTEAIDSDWLIAFGAQMSGTQATKGKSDLCPSLQAKNPMAVAAPSAVRRLTPRECERLQGFPDDWTKVPYRGRSADECADGPRYKALGNSMCVNVMRWIGERIAAVEAIQTQAEAA